MRRKWDSGGIEGGPAPTHCQAQGWAWLGLFLMGQRRSCQPFRVYMLRVAPVSFPYVLTDRSFRPTARREQEWHTRATQGRCEGNRRAT